MSNTPHPPSLNIVKTKDCPVYVWPCVSPVDAWPCVSPVYVWPCVSPVDVWPCVSPVDVWSCVSPVDVWPCVSPVDVWPCVSPVDVWPCVSPVDVWPCVSPIVCSISLVIYASHYWSLHAVLWVLACMDAAVLVVIGLSVFLLVVLLCACSLQLHVTWNECKRAISFSWFNSS